MAEKAPKKRSWGKPRHKERHKIAIIDLDKMEIDTEPYKITDKPSSPASLESPDFTLQHPELLSNEMLVRVLTKRQVPIPVYSDGKPSRERLVYLYRRHVTPQPQRLRGAGRRKRRRSAEEDNLMDVDDSSAISWDDWARSRDSEKNSASHKRKRKLEDSDSSPAKRPVDHTCVSFSKISVSDSEKHLHGSNVLTSASGAASVAAGPTTVINTSKKIIKIKRPAKTLMKVGPRACS